MPVFKFKVSWEDDDNINRSIALTNGQSFLQFHQAILTAFEFDKKEAAANFYESNDKHMKGRAISSEVLVNKKDAPALSMMKTPVSALVDSPDKKFIYEYDPVKNWSFFVELVGIDRDENVKISYPHCFFKEGISPILTGAKSLSENKMVELEEKYDLGKEEMDEGYGSEGEDDDKETDSDEESYGEEEYGEEGEQF
ncbi:MAG: hypothetical protein BGO31_04005 [Bacteroidetes bacterium 43-16]|nr:MAG: hypothetical protein BGO31_04005 [Bacteroidetes bacterium 43-16]